MFTSKLELNSLIDTSQQLNRYRVTSNVTGLSVRHPIFVTRLSQSLYSLTTFYFRSYLMLQVSMYGQNPKHSRTDYLPWKICLLFVVTISITARFEFIYTCFWNVWYETKLFFPVYTRVWKRMQTIFERHCLS